MRRILATRESIFKYGIYLPKNDCDADASPESARWRSGRQLEWLRLKEVQAFEYDWTKSRLALEHPDYKFSDIGHLFYIYDYKFSDEHRVRLVFDGSRQSPATYDLTYSPTVHPESIRIFHVFSVEMNWEIKQLDVPQAFLQSPIDHTIFAYPPRSHVERPGQILKLRLALYGAKQSSALFYKLLNEFCSVLVFHLPTWIHASTSATMRSSLFTWMTCVFLVFLMSCFNSTQLCLLASKSPQVMAPGSSEWMCPTIVLKVC
jgi:hypothetical protein